MVSSAAFSALDRPRMRSVEISGRRQEAAWAFCAPAAVSSSAAIIKDCRMSFPPERPQPGASIGGNRGENKTTFAIAHANTPPCGILDHERHRTDRAADAPRRLRLARRLGGAGGVEGLCLFH